MALARLAVAHKDHMVAITEAGGIAGQQAHKAAQTAVDAFGVHESIFPLIDALADMGGVRINLNLGPEAAPSVEI